MASGKAKYDPLESAKLGPDVAAAKPTAKAPPGPQDVDVSDLDEPVPVQGSRRPRYRLLADKRASLAGQLIDYKAGRVFDSAGYDIDQLKRQGLELELVRE